MKLLVTAKLFAVILFLMTFALCAAASGAESELERVACDVNAGPCSGSLKDIQVTLEIKPKPVKAMEDLTFTVRFAGAKFVADPYIDLGMPGMNMGRNRVVLKLTGESLYQGRGVIVR
jgi:hypothetical protein